jgi:hypothetical protein
MGIASRRLNALLLAGALALLLIAASGCTGSHAQAKKALAPAQKPSVIVVQDVAMYDKMWDHLVPHFQKGVVAKLKELQSFESVIYPSDGPMPDSAVALSGRITEVEKGNAALRWIVGFGAGQERVKGTFFIRNAQGDELMEFEAEETYAGGLGIGGAGFVDIEDLMLKFGESVAKRTSRWAEGKPIEMNTVK